jgi:hypothetical protein
MYDDIPPSPPTLMHFGRIGIPPFQELRIPIKVGREDYTNVHTMVTPSNSCMDEVNILRESILRGLKLCAIHKYM